MLARVDDAAVLHNEDLVRVHNGIDALGDDEDGHAAHHFAQTALDLTHAAIVETLRDGEPLRYGMQFEKVLPLFWQRIAP